MVPPAIVGVGPTGVPTALMVIVIGGGGVTIPPWLLRTVLVKPMEAPATATFEVSNRSMDAGVLGFVVVVVELVVVEVLLVDDDVVGALVVDEEVVEAVVIVVEVAEVVVVG